MRIRLFNKLLGQEMQDHVLKDCSLVIDAQNYFYEIYEKSKLSYEAGCESDRFAKFLKNNLRMFKKARVRCYFVFKGGSKDIKKRWAKKDDTKIIKNKVAPTFVKDICMQVLDEMGFNYVICKLEAKEQCAVIANELQCPVMSNDIEVAILCNSYINYSTLKFNPASNSIKCKLLHFDNFLKKYDLSQDKFVIFVLLTDETIYPEGYFSKVLQNLKATELLPKRYLQIFKWLSSKSTSEVISAVLEGFNSDDRERILLKEEEVRELLTLHSPGIPYKYLTERGRIYFTAYDPQWFEKGIALKYIAIPYINLYTDGVADGSWAFKDESMPDPILLSVDIMKYALNLLNNYSKDSSIVIRSDNGDKIEISPEMPDVPKPNYTVRNVVLENGWSRIQELNLFEHFLSCTIKDFDFDPLLQLPEDSKMLMIALIYMAHKSETWGEPEAYSVMLSYVALCGENVDMKRGDRQVADQALGPYFINKNSIDKNVIYPLIQFQHCLQQMNYLNTLCGRTYKPTVYSKTYNGQLVYNILTKLNNTTNDAFVQISQLLISAPTVMNMFKKLVDTHKKMRPLKN